MNNLPPGVRITDIPGNRPEDVRADAIWEDAWEELPPFFEDVASQLKVIVDTNSPDAFADACYSVVNFIQESGLTAEQWFGAIEDAASTMSEINDPSDPRY